MSCLPRLRPRFVSPFLHWVDTPAVPELHYTVYITGKPINFVKNIVSFQEEIFNSDTTANSEKGDVVLPAFPYESWANGWGSWKRTCTGLSLPHRQAEAVCCSQHEDRLFLHCSHLLAVALAATAAAGEFAPRQPGTAETSIFWLSEWAQKCWAGAGGSQNNWKKKYQKKNNTGNEFNRSCLSEPSTWTLPSTQHMV